MKDLESGGNFENDAMLGAKVLVIGTGEFGSAVAQAARLAEVRDGSSVSPCAVVPVSAWAFLNKQTVDEMAEGISDCRYIMYCGTSLTGHSQKIAQALVKSRSLASAVPQVDFIDWSNPDPSSDRNSEDVRGAVALTQLLEEAEKTTKSRSKRWWKVWKATGVSNLDVAGHEGKVKVTIYSGMTSSTDTPNIEMPGIVWRLPQQSSLLDEAHDRLLTRCEVDRWYDAFLWSLGIFIFAFVYAYTRYSKWVNGGYPDSMVPLYIMDKAISWTSLWMMVSSPFAGNILSMGMAMGENWSQTTTADKLLLPLYSIITIMPVLLFLIPYILWFMLRDCFWMGKSIYKRQDDKPGTARLKASLIDLVSLKHETGVVGFFWVFAHTMMGPIIADKAYKKKWFQENGRYYGNIEISLILGVIGATLITAVTMRSLFGKGPWMKLRPMYTFVSPLGIAMAALHVVFMGYTGWDGLFKYDVKKGQPSITFMSSIPTLIVLVVNFGLNVFGTKKRVGGQKIWKHSATHAAHVEYENTLRARAVFYGPVDPFAVAKRGKGKPKTVKALDDDAYARKPLDDSSYAGKSIDVEAL